ncbi:MAG: hypothetical protein JNL05_02550 [Flavobacteriales bacterium]|nr:hypothetical protein [Flavobacteriales bacterium]
MERVLNNGDRVLVMDEPFLEIVHKPQDALVVLHWKGYADPAQYRQGLETALAFVVEHRVKRWLADLRLMTAILKPEETWTNENWFPRLIAAGMLERMAILPSSDYFNQMSVERIMDHSSPKIPFKVGYFRSVDDGVAFLFEGQSERAEEVLSCAG